MLKKGTLCFDFVLSSEHVINFGEVVDTLDDAIDATTGSVSLLQVCLLP